MSSARARYRTARTGDECTNHEATATPNAYANITLILHKLTYSIVSSKVISLPVRNEILRSSFFGTIVQLAHIVFDDEMKAMTSEIVTARLITIQRDWGI